MLAALGFFCHEWVFGRKSQNSHEVPDEYDDYPVNATGRGTDDTDRFLVMFGLVDNMSHWCR